MAILNTQGSLTQILRIPLMHCKYKLNQKGFPFSLKYTISFLQLQSLFCIYMTLLSPPISRIWVCHLSFKCNHRKQETFPLWGNTFKIGQKTTFFSESFTYVFAKMIYLCTWNNIYNMWHPFKCTFSILKLDNVK